MKDYENKILEELKRKSIVSVGGTEAGSVAYAVGYARKKVRGGLKKIQITVDPSIFKNGLNVKIPGCQEQGLDFAAALGYVCEDVDTKLQLFSHYGNEQVEQAKKLLTQGKIYIKIKNDCDKLFIEALIESEENVVRVLIMDFHMNVISEETVSSIEELKDYDQHQNGSYIADAGFTLGDFVSFVENSDRGAFDFIEEGLSYNLALSKETSHIGMTEGFTRALVKYKVKEDMISYTQNLCMRTCEARFAGSKLPVMTAAGSANYGIAIYLANYGVGDYLHLEQERIINAIVLSNLMSLYVNAYIGSNSAICDCAFAVGIGVSAGVAYLLGGSEEVMEQAVKNMLGSITGILCDGDKLACVWKLGMTVDWAIKSALLALETGADADGGILDNTLDKILENISQIYNPVANTMNQSIVDIIMGK